MHSSVLRSSDFTLAHDGVVVAHDDLPWALSDRLGLVTGHALDGLGAAALVLSCVTSFYNRRREPGDAFLAYPDFFTFQITPNPASYGMLDIWPDHKNLSVTGDAWALLAEIAARAITILAVPAHPAPTAAPEPEDNRNHAVLDSLRRTVTTCYAYDRAGRTPDADTIITCTHEDAHAWGQAVIESAGASDRSAWNDNFDDGALTQSYRRIDVETAIATINALAMASHESPMP